MKLQAPYRALDLIARRRAHCGRSLQRFRRPAPAEAPAQVAILRASRARASFSDRTIGSRSCNAEVNRTSVTVGLGSSSTSIPAPRATSRCRIPIEATKSTPLSPISPETRSGLTANAMLVDRSDAPGVGQEFFEHEGGVVDGAGIQAGGTEERGHVIPQSRDCLCVRLDIGGEFVSWIDVAPDR